MSYIGCIYSLDEKLKISQLKSGYYPKDIDISKISKYISDHNIQIICQDDLNNNYHDKLLSIPSKPYILYAIGNLELLNTKIIGIVGPRKPSEYGTKLVSQTISLLSNKKNISTISGLAEGIDELVHNESINNNIPTIAILGGGLSYFLAGTKKNLIRKIIDNGGLIISEFKLKQKPAPRTFPQRNRIVAGLSDLILLPEASDNSGSLITANFGLNMKKPVYIIPNNIDIPTSAGSNKLLNHTGSKAIYNLKEWANENFESETNTNTSQITIKQQKISKENFIKNNENIDNIKKDILLHIIKGNNTVDKLLNNNVGIDYSNLISQITILEIEGYISSSVPGIFECK